MNARIDSKRLPDPNDKPFTKLATYGGCNPATEGVTYVEVRHMKGRSPHVVSIYGMSEKPQPRFADSVVVPIGAALAEYTFKPRERLPSNGDV